MEGMERIRDSILAQAEVEAQAIIKEAEEKISAMDEQAAKGAGEITRNRLAKAEIEAQEAAKRMLSMAELELKKKNLQAKQALIDQAFDKALSRLKSLSEQEYAGMIISFLGNAGLTGREELVVSPQDREMFEKGLLKTINDKLGFELKLSDETRNMQGGFVLKSKGVEINSSFETLLRMERERIETEIADILFQ